MDTLLAFSSFICGVYRQLIVLIPIWLPGLEKWKRSQPPVQPSPKPPPPLLPVVAGRAGPRARRRTTRAAAAKTLTRSTSPSWRRPSKSRRSRPSCRRSRRSARSSASFALRPPLPVLARRRRPGPRRTTRRSCLARRGLGWREQLRLYSFWSFCSATGLFLIGLEGVEENCWRT